MSGATSVAPGLNRTQAVSMDSGIHAMHKIHTVPGGMAPA